MDFDDEVRHRWRQLIFWIVAIALLVTIGFNWYLKTKFVKKNAYFSQVKDIYQ